MMQGPLGELLNMTEHGRSMSRFTGAPGHRNKAAQSSAAQSRAHHVGKQGWQAGSAAGGQELVRLDQIKLSSLDNFHDAPQTTLPSPCCSLSVCRAAPQCQTGPCSCSHTVCRPCECHRWVLNNC